MELQLHLPGIGRRNREQNTTLMEMQTIVEKKTSEMKT